MERVYGKRTGHEGQRQGIRQLSTTYGTPVNPVHSEKAQASAAFLVDVQAERLTAQMLDLDPEVPEIEPQGIGVDLVDETLIYTKADLQASKKRHRGHPTQAVWTADFRIKRRRTRGAVEVKTDEYPGDPAYLAMLDHAKHVLSRFDYELIQVVVPANTMRPIWSNVPLVYQAARRQDLKPTQQELRALESAVGARTINARELLEVVGRSLNDLPAFLASGAVRADLLSGHLKADTQVELAHGDLSHLSLLDRIAKR